MTRKLSARETQYTVLKSLKYNGKTLNLKRMEKSGIKKCEKLQKNSGRNRFLYVVRFQNSPYCIALSNFGDEKGVGRAKCVEMHFSLPFLSTIVIIGTLEY